LVGSPAHPTSRARSLYGILEATSSGAGIVSTLRERGAETFYLALELGDPILDGSQLDWVRQAMRSGGNMAHHSA